MKANFKETNSRLSRQVGIADQSTKSDLGVEKTYGKDSAEKNHELMKSFLQKYEKEHEELLQRHEEITKNFNTLLQINME